MRKIQSIILLAVAVLLVASPCLSANFIERHSANNPFRGLNGIGVEVVGTISREANKYGLTKDEIKRETISVLTDNGIKVLSEKDLAKTLGQPILLVKADVEQIESSSNFICGISLRLFEDVKLIRQPKVKFFAQTYEMSSSTESIGAHKMKDIVYRIKLWGLLKIFIMEYYQENPRQ